nr:hypothetical protein Iba_chr05aCG0070 [Ipomoea batatas]GME03812.1 hypothetical protein Iba_scaffold1380CG0090 [Ipomoea batatas]
MLLVVDSSFLGIFLAPLIVFHGRPFNMSISIQDLFVKDLYIKC